MLIDFKVSNFLSFNEEVTMNMIAANSIKEHEKTTKSSLNNIIFDKNTDNKLLKSSVIYGANASGKSNLLFAMSFFKNFILTSSSDKNEGDEIEVIKFLLSPNTENEPSFFQIIIIIDDVRYRYGFEADNEKIHSEWFFSLKSTPYAKETKLFIREYQEIRINKQSFSEGKDIEKKTRSNALFLSTVAQFDGEKSNIFRNWIKNNFILISGLEDEDYKDFTINKWKKEKQFRTILIEFFKTIKIGFEKIELEEKEQILDKLLPDLIAEEEDNELKEILENLQRLTKKISQKAEILNKLDKNVITKINFLHPKKDNTGNLINFVNIDFWLQSKGTQKLFNIFGIWIDAIENGKVLIIDELASSLHTLITIELIKIFHSNRNKSAQLIFATHDTNLLKKELFRRDQIWFTEKNNLGATDLYSLVEYKINQAKVRNDASFEKDYLLGKYGAIPFLGDIENFKNNFINEQED
ncbi:MAG: ATP-binding protein [Chlorobi bacterium]|nr:ATP-binding protein [Chlorobiota bacterium]